MTYGNYYLNQGIGVSGVAETHNPIYKVKEYNPFTGPRSAKVNVGKYFTSNSQYDEGLGDIESAIAEGLSVEDLRAESQGTAEMWGNALVNNIVIAGTTAISGTVGLVDGILEAAGTGEIDRLWNNTVDNWAVEMQEATREAFPIYKGTEYEAKNTWEKLGTGIFWAEAFQNLGFTEGMLIPGMGIANLVSKAPKLVRQLVPSFISSIGEGSIEAINTKNDEVNNKIALANARYDELSKGITDPYQLEILNQDYLETVQAIEEDAKDAGNLVLAANIALLTATNTLEFGKMFSRGFGTSKRVANDMARKGIRRITEGTYKGLSMPLEIGKAVGKKVLDATAEMGEEVSQEIIGRVPSNLESSFLGDYNRFNESQFNPEKRQLATDLMQGFMQSASEAMKDSHTYEAAAMGFFTGLFGVPVLRKRAIPVGLENSIFSEITEARDKVKRNNAIVDNVNRRLSEDKKINAYYNGLVRHLSIQEDMNNAIDRDDQFDYKTAESEQLISDIMMFDEIGDLDRLSDIINNSIDTSDEGIQSIIEETSKDGEGPFMQNGNPMSIKEIRTILEEKKKLLNSKIEEYKKDKEDYSKESPILGNDLLKAALFYRQQLRDYSNRFESLIDEGYEGLKKLQFATPNKEVEIGTKEEFRRNWFSNEAYINSINKMLNSNKSYMPYNERKELARILNDIHRVNNSLLTHNTNLTNLLENPTKFEAIINSTNEERVKADIKAKVDNVQSFAELDSLLQEGQITQDYIKNSKNPFATDYVKANTFVKEVKSAIDKSDYLPDQKEVLKNAVERRYAEEKNLSDLTNSSLITEVEGFESDVLSPFIEMANDSLNKRSQEVTEADTNKKSDTVDKEVTGNDNTGTVPVKTTAKINKISDLVKESIDKETVEGLVLPKIEETKKSVKAAISSKKDSDIDKANKDLNTLVGMIEELPESSNPEFRKEIDNTLDAIFSKLPTSSPEVTDSQLLDTTNDNTENIEVGSYYRSDLTEYTIDSFKEGTFIPYVPNRSSVKEIQSRIEYDYINKGNTKEGDTIELRQETIEGDTFTLMYHNNHMVGVLPLASNPKYKGIKGVNERLSKGEKVTLTVSKMMYGRYKFDRNKTRPVKDVSNLTELVLGVRKPVNGSLETVTNKDIKVESVYDELHSDGKVYMLLPNSKGTLSPKLLRVKHFNKEEFDLSNLRDSGNTRAKAIHSILERISKADNPDIVTDLFTELGKVLYLDPSFHMNLVDMGNNKVLSLRSKKSGRKNIVVERGASGTMILGSEGVTYSQPERVNSNTIYDELLEYLYSMNTVFNIQASKVNTGTYNNDLLNDDILYTHITDATTIGAWFTTTWYDDNGIEQKAVNPRGQFTPANTRTGTKVMVLGKQYYVNRGVVYDVNENEVTEGVDIIKDIAWIEENYGDKMNGIDMDNGLVILPSGKGFNRRTQKYLTDNELKELKDKLAGRASKIEKANATIKKLEEDQKKVKRDASGRPDTSNNESGESVYRIREEDGEYHEYKRVHSVVGDNWIGESTEVGKKAGENALKWGNMVDEIARRFFAGESNITRPSEMTEVAFNSLLLKLKQIKGALDTTGEIFNTKRIVVFKKYPDGTRVAGELDVLGFNPITGEFNIYDFKTSKDTFHATGKAVDKYGTKGDKQSRSNKEQHSLQLSSYKNMFDSSYDSSINGLYIIPFVLEYQEQKALTSIRPENSFSLSYNPSTPIGRTKEIEQETPLTQDPSKVTLEPKQVEGGKGDTSIFILNNEVVSGPTLLIGSVAGYEIRMYKEPVTTKGLGGTGEGTLYNYHVIFPNGNTYKIIELNNIEDQEASRMIMSALSKNPSKVEALSTIETQLGKYSKKEDSKSKLREAANKLDSTNKKTGNDSKADIGEEKPKPEVKGSKPVLDRPELSQSWNELPKETIIFLQSSSYTEYDWSVASIEERKSMLDCGDV